MTADTYTVGELLYELWMDRLCPDTQQWSTLEFTNEIETDYDWTADDRN